MRGDWPTVSCLFCISSPVSWATCRISTDRHGARIVKRVVLSLLVPAVRYCLFSSLSSLLFSEFGDVVATSGSLEVEDAVAFDDSVAAIRRHLDDGASNETVFEVCVV